MRASEFVHNEAGDGKTVLDGHFGVQTFMIKVCGFVMFIILSREIVVFRRNRRM